MGSPAVSVPVVNVYLDCPASRWDEGVEEKEEEEEERETEYFLED